MSPGFISIENLYKLSLTSGQRSLICKYCRMLFIEVLKIVNPAYLFEFSAPYPNKNGDVVFQASGAQGALYSVQIFTSSNVPFAIRFCEMHLSPINRIIKMNISLLIVNFHLNFNEQLVFSWNSVIS
jgi:hypothetical protein